MNVYECLSIWLEMVRFVTVPIENILLPEFSAQK